VGKMSRPRKKLRAAEEKLLWVSSAGMCNNPGCRQSLVFEDVGKPVCIGDNAHVIAHSTGGPRGQVHCNEGVRELDRDSWRNIILLCKNCHKQVDEHTEVYTEEVLFEWKAKHEKWIQTRLVDVENSIAVVHKTMGPSIDVVSLADTTGLKVLGLVSVQFQVDKVDGNGGIDWEDGKRQNVNGFEDVQRLMTQFDGVVLQLFPLSHIPLLIHFGSLVTNTVPVQVFQYDRSLGKWVLGSPSGEVSDELKLESSFTSTNSNVLAVILGISASVSLHDVNEILALDKIDLLQIDANSTRLDRVLYREDVQAVTQRFRTELNYRIGQQDYDEIHLFLAIPAGLALELGRTINPNMWPKVYTYHYSRRKRPRYQLALCV
jgi:hypothetical protein